MDLPLLPHLQNQLAMIAKDSISMVDECDVPSLCRTILKNITTANASSMTLEIRKEISSIESISPRPLSCISLMVEILWETLPASPVASQSFLTQIYNDCFQSSTVQYKLPLIDVCIILILIAEIDQEKYSKKCSQIALKWLNDGVFPFSHLVTILEMRSENEGWDKMLSGIWSLCYWVLSKVVQRSSSQTSHSSYNIPNLFCELRTLFFSFYTHATDYREIIVQFLLKYCHPITLNQTAQLPSFSSTVSPQWRSPLLPVHTLLSRSYLSSELYQIDSFDSSSNKQLAKYCCALLEEILKGHPITANLIFTSLINRIHSSPLTEEKRRQYCQLPRPFVLHRLLKCLMSFLTSLPALENTILITIQKLLNFLPFRHRESALSFSEYLFTSEFLPITEMGIFTQEISAIEDGTTLYSLPSVGLLFAGYLLLHFLEDSTNQIETETYSSSRRNNSQDILSIFTWIQRSFHSCKDDSRSILYCLDILSSVETKLHLNDQLTLCYRNSWQIFQSSPPDPSKHAFKTIIKEIESFASCQQKGPSILVNVVEISHRILTSMESILRWPRSKISELESISGDTFWIFYQVGHLCGYSTEDGSVKLAAFIEDVDWNQGVESTRIGPPETQKKKRKSRSTPSRGPVQDRLRATPTDLFYLCHFCDEYVISWEIEHEMQPCLQNLEIQALLRLSLSSSYAAALFAGHFLQSECLESVEIIATLSQLYVLISRFRYFVRLCEYRWTTGKNDSTLESKPKPKDQDSLLGKRRKNMNGKKDSMSNEETDFHLYIEAMRSLFEKQLFQLTKLTSLFPVASLVTLLDIPQLYQPHFIRDFLKQTTTIPSHILFTTTGLHILTSLIYFLSNDQQWYSSHSVYDASYLSITEMDFNIHSSRALISTSSQSNSLLPTLPVLPQSHSLILGLIFDLFAYFPALVRITENLRKCRNENILVVSSSSNLADILCYEDLSLMQCLVYMSVNFHLLTQAPHLQAPNLQPDFIKSPFWTQLWERFSLVNQTLTSPTSIVDSTEKIVTLCSQLESHILLSSHPSVSICASRLLISLSASVDYSSRIRSIFWLLTTSLHESNKKSFYPVNKRTSERNGLLALRLGNYLCDIPDLFTGPTSNVFTQNQLPVVKQCRTLLHQATSLSSSRALGFGIHAENESFGTFVMSWALWWDAERPHTEEYSRVYGLFLLILKIYLLKKSHGKIEMPSDNVEESNKSKMRRTSRMKKPVDRYQPEFPVDDEIECDTSDDEVIVADSIVDSKVITESALDLNDYLDSIKRDVQIQHNDIQFLRIQIENSDKYLSFALSFLPTLLFYAIPVSKPPSQLNYDEKWGPYVSIIFSIQVYLFTVSEYTLLISIQERLQTVVSHSIQMIQICKVGLGALEITLQRAVDWRQTVEGTSWTSSDYLIPLFQAALIFLETMTKFANSLINQIISSNAVFPKRLIQSAPQLVVLVDRTLVKVNNLIQSYHLEGEMTNKLSESEGIDSFQWLVDRSIFFDNFHRNLPNRPKQSQPLAPQIEKHKPISISRSRQLAAVAISQSSVDSTGNETHVLSTNSFRVATVEKFGWGIY